MARTYRTLSVSLHPDVLGELERRGKRVNRTAARVAAEMIDRALHTPNTDTPIIERVTLSPFVGRARDAMIELNEISRELGIDVKHLVTLYEREPLARVLTTAAELLRVARDLRVDVGLLVAVYLQGCDDP